MAVSKQDKLRFELLGDLKKFKGKLDPRTYKAYETKISITRGLKRLAGLGVEIKNFGLIEGDKITKKKIFEEESQKKIIKSKVDILNINEMKTKNYGTIVDPFIVLKKFFEKYKGKNIEVYYYVGDDLIRYKKYQPIPLNFSKWFNNSQFNEWMGEVTPDTIFEDNKFKGYLYVVKNEEVKLTPKKVKQFFMEGVSNCLLTPILNWVDQRIMEVKKNDTKKKYLKKKELINQYIEQYKEGVPEDEIANICNNLQIDINVDLPFGNIHYVQCKSTKKALEKFNFINTRLNHVDNFNNVLSIDNKVYLNKEELTILYNQLKTSGIFFLYSMNFKGVNKIITGDAIYSISSEYKEITLKFEKESGLINCKIDDIQNKELSNFIKHATHYNSCRTLNFCEEEEINHIDMKNAYFNFHKCKFYAGFLGKITDFRAVDSIQGVGLYRIYDLDFTNCDDKFKYYNDVMKIYLNNNIYPSVELEMLNLMGVSFKINLGCWGVKSIDFRFPDEFLRKEDKIYYYSKWTGQCDNHDSMNNFKMYGDENFYRHLLYVIPDDVKLDFNDNEINVCYPKKCNYHLGHITAFILAYQRLNVIEQLMAMDKEKILRVAVDGIYFINHDIELKNVFRYKEEKDIYRKLGLGQAEAYISNLNLDNEELFVYANKRKNFKNELFIGAGGNGKTHMNLKDDGFVSVGYVSPSWKLARKKNEEYGICSTVWARLVSNDDEKINFIKRHFNVLIIDEVSMMTDATKKFIFETYNDMKLIFCGDLGYQLGPYGDEQMSNIGFDNIQELKINYRCKCEILKNLLEDIRGYIRDGLDRWTINDKVNYELMRLGRFVNMDDLKKAYNIDDMILSGVNINCDYFTEIFKGKFENEKYYVLENNRRFNNGEIVIGEKPDAICEVKHAFSVHCIQGETAEKKLFIDSSKLFDSRMYYTALSRARTIEQIYIIRPDKEMIQWIKNESEKRRKV